MLAIVPSIWPFNTNRNSFTCFFINMAAHDFRLLILSQINREESIKIINVSLTSTFIMTNFVLSSAICFDSAITGFKAEKKTKKRKKVKLVMRKAR